MNLTAEQHYIIEQAMLKTTKLLKIEAVAGSGKTSTLVQLAKAYKPKLALYTAFNKAIVEEAKESFSAPVQCKTLHAVAYQHTVAGTTKKIDEFTYSCIKENISFTDKVELKKIMEQYFNCSELSLKYLDNYLPPHLATIAKKYIHKMAKSEIPVTFGFILKYFHIKLSQGLEIPEYDLLMLDEAGDVTGVTLEIFKLLRAKLKIMVGDTNQNIYTFMGTVNGFVELINEGITCTLSQSFRVNVGDGKLVQKFLMEHVHGNVFFKGTEHKSCNPKTMAYISRTNGGLIRRMIDLNAKGVKYSLLRRAEDIFSLPLALMNLREDRPTFKREHRYLREALIAYNRSTILQTRFSTFRKYLIMEYGSDPALKNAIKLVNKYSYKLLYATYNDAKSLPKTRQSIIVTTAHTSKGLTFDSTYIEEDLNQLVAKVKAIEDKSEEDEAELRLAYVAVTRHKYKLYNATFLHDEMEQISNEKDDNYLNWN